MLKYIMWFCDCGRIHPLSEDDVKWLGDGVSPYSRSIIKVCTNCARPYKYFLEDDPWGGDDDFYINESGTVDSVIDTSVDKLKDFKVIFSKGIKVPMATGGYANGHTSDTFIDQEYIGRNFGNYSRTVKKNPDCIVVDTERLIREVNDDDILRAMSRYNVGIDWTGTKYERGK